MKRPQTVNNPAKISRTPPLGGLTEGRYESGRGRGSGATSRSWGFFTIQACVLNKKCPPKQFLVVFDQNEPYQAFFGRRRWTKNLLGVRNQEGEKNFQTWKTYPKLWICFPPSTSNEIIFMFGNKFRKNKSVCFSKKTRKLHTIFENVFLKKHNEKEKTDGINRKIQIWFCVLPQCAKLYKFPISFVIVHWPYEKQGKSGGFSQSLQMRRVHCSPPKKNTSSRVFNLHNCPVPQLG